MDYFNKKMKGKVLGKMGLWEFYTSYTVPNYNLSTYFCRYSREGFKSIHTNSCKFIIYFTRKKLLFLFYTITFLKYPYQFIYFTNLL